MSRKTALRPAFVWLLLMFGCACLSVTSVYIIKITGALGSTTHDVCFSVTSSVEGVTQLFRSTTPGIFNEQKSESKALNKGTQTICFKVSLGEQYLRWDPSNVTSTMQIDRSIVNFYGFRQLLPLKQLQSSSRGITSSSEMDTPWLLNFVDGDPQIFFEIDDSTRRKELLYAATLITLAYFLVIIGTIFLLKKLILEKNPSYCMAIFAMGTLIIIYQFSGIIAVSDGAGWDGSAYLNLLFDWIQSGHLPNADPYRMSRLPGFTPLITLAFLINLSAEQLIHIQVALNIIGYGVALGLFLDYLLRSGVPLKSATQYSIIMLLSWPILVISTYYPLLSDHFATIISCFSLWCFSKKYRVSLLVSCAISPLVMPGLFLLPLTLLAFASTQESNILLSRWRTSTKFKITLFTALSLTMVSFTYSSLSQISDSELLNIGSSIAPGSPRLRTLSTICVLTSLIVAAWLWSDHFSKSEFISKLSIKWLILAMIASVTGHAILYFGLNWDNGFRGPNLWQNMLFQSINSPLKPLISHFIYYGPLFITALVLLFRSTDSTRLHYPVKIAILGFLPILAIGSETRQWIALLPFLAAFVAQSSITSKVRKLILVFSVLLALPLFWLAGSVEKAVALKLSMTEPLWQLYFGRHGPWMSYTTYLVNSALMLVFFTSWLLAKDKIAPKKTAADVKPSRHST